MREALSALDLDAEVRPCPRGGTRFGPELEGGSVPRLEDPNAPAVLTGSSEIVAHLHPRYGTGRPPRFLNLTPARFATGAAARLLTGQRGAVARASRAPAVPLELWAFESSPYCRMARAVLSVLGAAVPAAQPGQGLPAEARFRGDGGQDAGAVPVRPEHRGADVREPRDRAVPGIDVRALTAG